MAPKSSSLSLTTGMLAFSRGVQVSSGLFYGLPSDAWDPSAAVPVEVVEAGIRGQISDRGTKKAAGGPNLQTIETAALPPESTHLALRFSVRIVPSVVKPHASDKPEVSRAFADLVAAYAAAGGFEYLAAGYLENIANGRFAWRNRVMTDRAWVGIASNEGHAVTFDPFAFDLGRLGGVPALVAGLTSGVASDVEALVSRIGMAMTGKPLELTVTWIAASHPGAEVFPSQEFVREEAKDDKVGRVLAKAKSRAGGLPIDQAAMHPQKIGAALRFIDAWHDSPQVEGPIPVNPYGGIQETSDAVRKGLRAKTAPSFFDLQDDPDFLVAELSSGKSAAELDGNVHFFFANLLRGGVFGGKE